MQGAEEKKKKKQQQERMNPLIDFPTSSVFSDVSASVEPVSGIMPITFYRICPHHGLAVVFFGEP